MGSLGFYSGSELKDAQMTETEGAMSGTYGGGQGLDTKPAVPLFELRANRAIPDLHDGLQARRESCSTCQSSSGTGSVSLDSVQWKGTSSLARFGLDIGGTLCKLVYFEPVTSALPSHLVSPGSLGECRGLDEGSEGSEAASERTNLTGACNPSERAMGAQGLEQLGDSEAAAWAQNRLGRKDAEDGGREAGSAAGSGRGEDSGLQPISEQDEVLNHSRGSSQPCHSEDQPSRSQRPPTNENAAPAGDPHSSRTLNPDHALRDDLFHSVCSKCGASSSESSRSRARKIWQSSHEPIFLPGRGTLYFKRFETWKIEEFLSLTREHSLVTGSRAIGATGGGARKFGEQFLEVAGLHLHRADELTSLVRGIDFLARHASEDSFVYPTGSYSGGSIQRPWQSPENSGDEGCETDGSDESSPSSPASSGPSSGRHLPPIQGPGSGAPSVGSTALGEGRRKGGAKKGRGGEVGPQGSEGKLREKGALLESGESLYPYLVVNIGSGVSILRVDSADSFERVGGTSLGGSTFLGLTSILTGCDSFEDAIALAARGDSTTVDMLVGDIYGGDYTEMGLAATTVASSFGKLVQPTYRSAAERSPQHLAKAALLMVTNNVGSLAMLHARPAGVRNILFAGSFLHDNKLAMRLLAVAVDFWSKGNMKAVFLRHEGHAGAMGALLSSLDVTDDVDAMLFNGGE